MFSKDRLGIRDTFEKVTFFLSFAIGWIEIIIEVYTQQMGNFPWRDGNIELIEEHKLLDVPKIFLYIKKFLIYLFINYNS